MFIGRIIRIPWAAVNISLRSNPKIRTLVLLKNLTDAK
jgi:hypothetical protein